MWCTRSTGVASPCEAAPWAEDRPREAAIFYRPEDGHGLRYDPFNAVVAPRPIGWISTRGVAGDNLAPYSFFNALAFEPPQVVFSSIGTKPDRARGKDTLSQVEESGVFCVNLATGDLREQVNATSATLPSGSSEFSTVGLAAVPCDTIDCLRVADGAAALECRATRVLTLPGAANVAVLGEVVGIHLRDDCLLDGRFDARPAGGWLARLGYRDFAVVTELFAMHRPH